MIDIKDPKAPADASGPRNRTGDLVYPKSAKGASTRLRQMAEGDILAEREFYEWQIREDDVKAQATDLEFPEATREFLALKRTEYLQAIAACEEELARRDRLGTTPAGGAATVDWTDKRAEIVEHLDILAVFEDRVILKKAGREYMGKCPFHEDKNPSFSLNPENGLWHCFGCQAGGNIFEFVMQSQRISFVDALYQLARRAGVDLPEHKGEIMPTSPGTTEVPAVGTDADNAELFVSEHGEDIRWCQTLRSWLAWDSVRWKRDNELAIEIKAEKTARALIVRGSKLPPETAKRVVSAGLQLLVQWKMISMIEASKRKTIIAEKDLDNDRGFLTVRNGVVDLRTGALGPFDKTRYSTHMTDIDFDPDAKCPKWVEFLQMIMADNEDEIRWLQRAVGYSLTGYGDAKMFAFLHGTGDNGKSTFLETINILAGEYAHKTSIEALSARSGKHQEQKNTPFTAALRGMRFVFTDEIPDGFVLNTSLTKDLSGGDTITGMAKYAHPITFLESHFLWLYGNSQPIIHDESDAMWGRVRLVNFGVTIPVEMRRPIGEVKEMFRAELPGILNWAVEGAIIAIEEGVGTTELITAATQEYRADEDMVGRWLKEECTKHPKKSTEKHDAYNSFRAWADREGIYHIPQAKTLTQRLRKLGIELGGSQRQFYVGFEIGASQPPEELDHPKEAPF